MTDVTGDKRLMFLKNNIITGIVAIQAPKPVDIISLITRIIFFIFRFFSFKDLRTYIFIDFEIITIPSIALTDKRKLMFIHISGFKRYKIKTANPRELSVSDLSLKISDKRTTPYINPALKIEGVNPARAAKSIITIIPIMLLIFLFILKNDKISITKPTNTERLKPDAAKRWASPTLFI